MRKDDDHGHDYDDDEYDDHLPQCALVLYLVKANIMMMIYL